MYEAEAGEGEETRPRPHYHTHSHAHADHQHTASGDEIKAEEVAGENDISSLKPTIDLHFQPPKINPFPITAPENNDFEENKKEIIDTDNTNGNSPDLNKLVKDGDETEDVDDYDYYDFELINDINQRSNVSNEDYYLLLPTYFDEPDVSGPRV